jgi:hypothetical protein
VEVVGYPEGRKVPRDTRIRVPGRRDGAGRVRSLVTELKWLRVRRSVGQDLVALEQCGLKFVVWLVIRELAKSVARIVPITRVVPARQLAQLRLPRHISIYGDVQSVARVGRVEQGPHIFRRELQIRRFGLIAQVDFIQAVFEVDEDGARDWEERGEGEEEEERREAAEGRHATWFPARPRWPLCRLMGRYLEISAAL